MPGHAPEPCSTVQAGAHVESLRVQHCLNSYEVAVRCESPSGSRIEPYALAATSRDSVRVHFRERVSAKCEVFSAESLLRASDKAAEQIAEAARLWRLRGHLLMIDFRVEEAKKAYAEADRLERRR